jgi:transposase
MEMMGRTKRLRRSFTDEFKAEVVELVRQPGNSAASVARDFDLSETAVRAWVKQADIDDGHRDGMTTAERAELAQLRRENRCCARSATSSSGRRLSSRGRPGERVPVHRGGEG